MRRVKNRAKTKSNVAFNLSKYSMQYTVARTSVKRDTILDDKDLAFVDGPGSTNSGVYSDSPVQSLDEIQPAGEKEESIRLVVKELLDDDFEEMKGLMNELVEELFNIVDPFMVFHSSFITYKVTNDVGKIVGVIIMNEYPNVPAVHTAGWADWADKLYNIKNLSSYNSIWIHLIAFDKDYEEVFFPPLLNNLFNEFITKQFALIVIPKGCHNKVAFLDGCSSVILPQDYTDPMKVQTIRLCVRQDFVTQYKIRRAVEEDNDDLVLLIHKYSPRFVQLYGDYYVAEILAHHTAAGRNLIVAEHENEAVGVLCLNPTVNYEQLNACFDLHVFTGLYKPETAKQTAEKKLSSPKLEPEKPTSIRQSEAAYEVKRKSDSKSKQWIIFPIWTSYQNQSKIRHTSELNAESMQRLLIDKILDEMEILSYKSSSSMISELNPSHVSDSPEEYFSDTSESTISDLPFGGTEQAFAIEILASQPNHQASLSLLIIACFECFPKRDYCVLTIPHEADYYPILKYFTRVSPKLSAPHPHDLYVCHRGQISPVQIQTATLADTERITRFTNLISHPTTPGQIVSNFESGLSGKNHIKTYLALSGKHSRYMVGLAQVSRVLDMEAIRRKYAINRRCGNPRNNDFTFGYLVTFVMSPLFSGHVNFFLREIHRKTSYKSLFYALNTHDCQHYQIRPMSCAIRHMWLAQPRKFIISPRKSNLDYPEEPYALFVSTPKLLSKPVVEINHRIVVIGASETALGFLEALITNTVIHCLVIFNNVLLISTDGLVKQEPHNPIRNMLLAKHTLTCATYLEKIALHNMISILQGVLTKINREDKVITVNKKVQIPYDYLFLMSGLQYGPPKQKGMSSNAYTVLPSNCFTINTEKDADRALFTLETLIKELEPSQRYEIVVYGHNIDCYCCVAALLKFGIRSDSIILVDPGMSGVKVPDCHQFVFQDGNIYEKVINVLEHSDVTIQTGFKLVDWYSKPFRLKFESFTRYLILRPLCAFLYGEKTIDYHMANVIHESRLVFDGRLVIDPDFHTSDRCIYAAGPLTKYARKIWADHMAHKYFNSTELGAQLGQMIRRLLLPFKERKIVMYNMTEKMCQKSNVAPYFFEPLVTYCQLPGGLFYCNVMKPGQQVPLETAMSDSDYGTVYTTGNCSNLKEHSYFRLHLNQLGTVETITCLASHKFDFRKLVYIWGEHEALLNNLVKQFENLKIADFFEYFETPWCSAIFHDDFPLLQVAVAKVMMSVTDVPGDSPLENLTSMYKHNGYKPLSEKQQKLIEEKFFDSGYEEKIQQLILDFIKERATTLDMYAHPVIVNCILSGYEESPLFKKS